MPIPLDFIAEFHVSVERHLDESKDIWMETGSKTSLIPGTSAKLALEAMPSDYFGALQDLHNKISSKFLSVRLRIRLTEGPMAAFFESPVQELDSLVLLSPTLLWMIPAFCFCSQFLDPLDAYERCVAIQKTRSSQEANFTDDIWDKDLVHDWAGSDDSRLLLLQGNSQTTKRFERFATEVVQALKANQIQQSVRLVYILNTPRTGGASNQLAPSDLLQQVAVQCLQYVRPNGPVSFLINMFGRFKRAVTSQDWFGILQDICLSIPSLYIIIDLAVLGPNHAETQSWSVHIQNMFNFFKSFRKACRMKIMLLCCHRLTSQFGETLVINGQPARSASSRNRHQTRKYLRRIMIDPEDTSLDYIENLNGLSVRRSTSPSRLLEYTATCFEEASTTNPGKLSDMSHSDIASLSLPVPQHRGDFKIAIICALTLESDAIQDVFDKRWDEIKYGKMPGDPNQYTLGVIGRHHVVVVHMPGMGKSNGASVAANCRASFPSLGLVLVVGICGGAPFTRSGGEIVLGDIIVSDGLIQYDFGRQFPDRFVRKNDTISKPNAEILSFLAKMKGRWSTNRLKERTAVHLEYLRKATGLEEIAKYPGAMKDKLYEPTYRHKHQAAADCDVCNRCRTRMDPVCEAALTLDCESLQCNARHLVARKRLAVVADEINDQRTTVRPSIHFGLYASGDKVMKSGEEREVIAKNEGVIAFEMEGSGVWEVFPGRCLVIKAVCDYADSHKNKRWQSYAAASAAACTKAFLESWSA